MNSSDTGAASASASASDPLPDQGAEPGSATRPRPDDTRFGALDVALRLQVGRAGSDLYLLLEVLAEVNARTIRPPRAA